MADRMLREVYRAFEGSYAADEYSLRHNIKSAAILTITDDETAHAVLEFIGPRIEGKTVVEIGGGVGLLSLHMGDVAKRVYCIEANPMWSWIFAAQLLHEKPKNVSYLFGSADEFFGSIKADVAIFCTHSGVESMREVSRKFAPIVIDVYGEVISKNQDAFDPLASMLRKSA